MMLGSGTGGRLAAFKSSLVGQSRKLHQEVLNCSKRNVITSTSKRKVPGIGHRREFHGLLNNRTSSVAGRRKIPGLRRGFHGTSVLSNKHKDYYEVLGVDRSVDQATLKKKYRELAKKYHPDQSKEPDATTKFQEITHAYEVLSDPDKRKAYDSFGPDFEQAGGFGGGPGFGDFGGASGFGGFEEFFRSAAGGGQGFGFDASGNATGARTATPRPIELRLDLSFMEAVKGCEKDINFRGFGECSTCSGSGAKDGGKPTYKVCQACNGKGQRMTTVGGFIQMAVQCEECNGVGREIENPCGTCEGTGLLRDQLKSAKITIPAGIDNGNILHVPGKGHSGAMGSQPGNLEIEIRVRRDKHFERKGTNIITQCNVSLAQAVLGDKVSVKTLEGEVDLKVPAGVKPGEKVRLRGRGIKHPNAPKKGDQYVYFNVEIPKNLTDRQKELMKEFREEELKQQAESN